MLSWNAFSWRIFFLVLGVSLFIPAVFGAGQTPTTPASPVTSPEPDFTFSVYYSGNMQGNLEPCG
jgi:hypothetical protein